MSSASFGIQVGQPASEDFQVGGHGADRPPLLANRQRVLGPDRDFPKVTEGEVLGKTGVVVGVEDSKLLVDLDGHVEPG